jgi:hypothetical protein
MPAPSAGDREIVRKLAGRVAEIAALPVMAERRGMWKRHNRLDPPRPMILVFPEGSWRELLPESALECQDREARAVEAGLRRRIYTHEHFRDDTVIEGEWLVSKTFRDTGWGLESKRIESGSATGAWHFDPVVKVPGDLKKLRFPEVSADPAETGRRVEWHRELLGDALPVRLVGKQHVSFHLMNIYAKLRGLEQVMLDMYENPGMLHEAMRFFTEWHERLVEQYLALGLLDFNNDGTYQNSGGVGYSDELPRAGGTPGQPRPCDLWASAEAQELTLVSPEMHEEFSLQYERRLLAPFGLNGYGCCEVLDNKLQYVTKLPNLRRVSISPFANVERCAEQLGGRYIFSWKPHPAHLVGDFDEKKVRDYIRAALEAARANGCVVEMILKDTHTCENRPERFTRWTEIARELAERG